MARHFVQDLQRYYPQIYLACHVDHVRTKSNRHHLSAHDSALLAHLDVVEATPTGNLARHLGVANSTLSAAIKRLESLGHVIRTPQTGDRRRIGLRLTPKGAVAMAATSVLDAKRVSAVLAELAAEDQDRAIHGLALLARAARAFQAKTPRRKRW